MFIRLLPWFVLYCFRQAFTFTILCANLFLFILNIIELHEAPTYSTVFVCPVFWAGLSDCGTGEKCQGLWFQSAGRNRVQHGLVHSPTGWGWACPAEWKNPCEFFCHSRVYRCHSFILKFIIISNMYWEMCFLAELILLKKKTWRKYFCYTVSDFCFMKLYQNRTCY